MSAAAGGTSWASSEATQGAFSGRNARIAFVRHVGRDYRIYKISANGTGERRVTDHDGHEPAWSPNGKRLAYSHLHGNGSGPDDGFEIYKIRASGRGRVRLTDGAYHDSFDPTWAPNGKKIAFYGYDGSD